ncbi:MAG: hypothetical protein WA875_16250, partial [Candidatus Acidiferrales bacterium]
IAFSTEAAKQNALVALVAAWSPVVETVLSFVTTRINFGTFNERAAEEGLVEEVARAVGAILYASKKSLPFASFIPLVAGMQSRPES